VRCSLFLFQRGESALALAAYNGHLAMVKFFHGRRFNLDATDAVRVDFSYIACFFVFSSSVTGAIRAFEIIEISKTSVVTKVTRTREVLLTYVFAC
jgi:hypothetical protein